MKIIKSSKDLENKIDFGISLSEYSALYEKCMKKDLDLKDPFLAFKQKSKLNLKLLKLCYEKKYLNNFEYILSLLYLNLYIFLKIPKSFFSSNLKHWRFSNKVISENYKAITCTKGLARTKVNLFNEDEVYDIPLTSASKNLRINERISTILIMMRFRVSSYQHAAQFFILKKHIPKITATLLIIEEGFDFSIQCFVFLLRPKVKKTMLTLRGPSMFPGLKHNYDSILVNNRITYDQLAHKNSNVFIRNFPPDFNLHLYSAKEEELIGFAPDISNPVLSRFKKKSMDKSFFEKTKDQGVYLTLHPSDNIEHYLDYLKLENVTLRIEEDIETYFSKIDILVTWWSTMIFQAIYCGTPVIVLDLFDDGQSDHVSKFTNNFVRTVKSISELNKVIEEIRNCSFDQKKLNHKIAMRKVYPLSDKIIYSD